MAENLGFDACYSTFTLSTATIADKTAKLKRKPQMMTHLMGNNRQF